MHSSLESFSDFIAMPINLGRTTKTLKRQRERVSQYDRLAMSVSEGYVHVERAAVPPPPPAPIRLVPKATSVVPPRVVPPPASMTAQQAATPATHVPPPASMTVQQVAPGIVLAPSVVPAPVIAPSAAPATVIAPSTAPSVEPIPRVRWGTPAAAAPVVEAAPDEAMSCDDDDKVEAPEAADDDSNSSDSEVARSASITPENPDVVTADTYLDIVRVLESVPDRGTSVVHLVSYGRSRRDHKAIETKVHNWTDTEVPRHHLGKKDWETSGCTGLNGRILMSMAMNPGFVEIIAHAKRCIKRKDSPHRFPMCENPMSYQSWGSPLYKAPTH